MEEKKLKAIKAGKETQALSIQGVTDEIFIRVTPKQAALVALIRNMQHGTLTECIIKRGEPVVVKATTQRIDFERPDELESLFELLVDEIREALPVTLAPK